MPARTQHIVSVDPVPATATAFSEALQTIQACLACGDLTGADRAIRAAYLQSVSHEDERKLTVFALRRQLMSGRYHEWEDAEGVWHRALARWQEDSELKFLQQALFCSAGWSKTHLNAITDDFHDLLSVFGNSHIIEPEILYPKLTGLAQDADGDPALLTTLVSKPLPNSLFNALGEQMLPPTVEALLAENWYTHSCNEPYPRTELIIQFSATEKTFRRVANYLRFWEELRHHHLRDAAELTDTFYANQDYGCWLRALPVIVHFGSAAQIGAIPRRLQKALQFTSHDSQMPPGHQPFQQTTQFLAKSLRLWWEESDHAQTVPDKATQQFLIEAAYLPVTEELPFWSGRASFSPSVNHFLYECVASPLSDAIIKQLSLPAIVPAHVFTHAIFLARSSKATGATEETENVIGSWLALPATFRNEQAYQKVLLDYLEVAKQSLKLSDVTLLVDVGVPVSELLSDQLHIELFLTRPTRSHLNAVNNIPRGNLVNDWLSLLEVVLPLYQHTQSDKAVEAILRRLTSGPDLPPPETCHDIEGLKRIAEILKNLPLDGLTLTVALRVALRAGYMVLHETAMELLDFINEKHPKKTASVLARLWLKTGHAQYIAREQWVSSDESWASAALCWHQLLTLADLPDLPQYPQTSTTPTPLREAFLEISAWVMNIQISSVLAKFEHQDSLLLLAEDWAFLKPIALKSISYANSIEDVAPILTALLRAANYSISEQEGLSSARAVLISYASGVTRAEYAAATLAKSATECPNHYYELMRQCTGMFSSHFTWKLRKALLAVHQHGHVNAVDAENVSSLSDAAKKVLSYPLNEVNEQPIRLALPRVVEDDLHHPQIWQVLADFLRSNFFSPCSKAQWEMVSAFREKVRGLNQNDLLDMISALEDEDRVLIDKMCFQPLKPVLIDVSNLIYDAAVEPYVDDPFNFIECVWQTLVAADFYPILSYIDKPKIRHFSPDIMRHLNRLTHETKIRAMTGQTGYEASADYHLLLEAGRWIEEQAPLIVTNDYFAKPYRADAKRGEVNGWLGHPEFTWLNEALFDSMRTRFTQGGLPNTWEIVTPDSQRLIIRNNHTE